MRLTGAQARKLLGEKAPSKYHSKKCQWKGMTFDSIHERDRFIILESEMQKGKITDLNRQVRFQLLPAQTGENGKVIERPLTYVADFVYRRDGELVVEDAKSKATRTHEYIIKRKLMLWFHGIRIQEV